MLQRVAKNYEAGFRDYKKPLIKWVAHPKGDVDINVKPTIGDLKDKGGYYEDSEGQRYLVIESKLNNF